MVTDVFEHRFRALVDDVPATLSGPVSDLASLYGHFGMTTGDVLRRSDVTGHLYAVVASALSANGPPDQDLLRLRRQLVLRYFADEVPLEPYAGVAQVLQDAAKRYVIPFDDVTRWRTAVSAAKDYLILQPQGDLANLLIRRRNAREAAAGDAIHALRRAGYTVDPFDGTAHIVDSEKHRIARAIDSHVEALGGIDVADRIFRAIRPHYDASQQRHHLVRRASTSVIERPASVPWAYLLNLAAKHAHYAPERPGDDERFREIVRLATSLAATFDVEPYNIAELHFHVGRDLPLFLSSIAVYDGMFTLVQSRPADLPRLLRALLGWVSAASLPSLGFTFEEAFSVSDAVIASCRGSGPVIVSDSAVSRASGVALDRTAAVLSALAHERDPNSKYLTPDDLLEINAWQRPLCRESAGEYLILDRSWCAPAFYEALAGAARQVVPNSDDRIGVALESFVRDLLAQHGVAFASGKYRTPDGHAECDAIVETSSVVIFIEVKKKTLTREARAGKDVAILLDLAKSMFHAQIQLTRHELALYKHGRITVAHDGVERTITRGSRSVERVAVGLLDFGGMHDRTVLGQILDTMIRFDLHAENKASVEPVAAVRERALQLKEVVVALEAYRPQRAPFFSSWLLSLGHLMVMLDGVTNNETFKESMFASRHMSFGSLDLYFEHGYMRRANASRRG